MAKRKLTDKEKIEQLQKQLKSTQKALKEAELKNKLLDTMIDIAEEKFDVPVRKKPSSQPSQK